MNENIVFSKGKQVTLLHYKLFRTPSGSFSIYELVRKRAPTKQRRTKPEGKSVLCKLCDVESLTNAAAQLLGVDTAESFYG